MKKYIYDSVEGPFSPPDKDDPREYSTEGEAFEVEIPNVIIKLSPYGDFDYEDEEFPWVPDGFDSDEIPGLTFRDQISIVEDIDELLFNILPAKPGTYKMNGVATLVYAIENVAGYELDEFTEELDTDTMYVDFLEDQSEINVTFKRINP